MTKGQIAARLNQTQDEVQFQVLRNGQVQAEFSLYLHQLDGFIAMLNKKRRELVDAASHRAALPIASRSEHREAAPAHAGQSVSSYFDSGATGGYGQGACGNGM